MAKKKTKYQCNDCGYESAKWMGRCPSCNEWNTFIEETYFAGKAAKGVKEAISNGSTRSKTLNEIDNEHYSGYSTGLKEFDRVLGESGLVKGSVTLIAGEPGKGKSTVLSQLANFISTEYGTVIYQSGEESEAQGKKRFEERMNLSPEKLRLLHTKDIEIIEKDVEENEPVLLIVDSIQMVGDSTVASNPGSVSQINACTARLIHLAKTTGTAVVIVGQVLKDNSIAGPKQLEHMVDTVLYLEGEKYNDLRLLRVHKNRFGSANELGIFEMVPEGLVEIENPSVYLLENRQNDASGSAVVCISDNRPLMIEVQALVSPPFAENATPRRTSEGFSRNKLNIIIAVLEKKCKVPLSYKDVYLNVAGGMTVDEPGADLGVAMSLYSSDKNQPIPADCLILGEVGLTGEVRPVSQVEQLLNEADKVGFRKVVLPTNSYEKIKDKYKNKFELFPVRTVNDAIKCLFTT